MRAGLDPRVAAHLLVANCATPGHDLAYAEQACLASGQGPASGASAHALRVMIRLATGTRADSPTATTGSSVSFRIGLRQTIAGTVTTSAAPRNVDARHLPLQPWAAPNGPKPATRAEQLRRVYLSEIRARAKRSPARAPDSGQSAALPSLPPLTCPTSLHTGSVEHELGPRSSERQGSARGCGDV